MDLFLCCGFVNRLFDGASFFACSMVKHLQTAFAWSANDILVTRASRRFFTCHLNSPD
ncbi:hypothetical protein PSAC2689_20272 [Paraburkholderia sacchari]